MYRLIELDYDTDHRKLPDVATRTFQRHLLLIIYSTMKFTGAASI